MYAAPVFLLGLACVAVGAGLVYVPAGLIVAGLMLAGGAYVYERGRRVR